LVNAARVPDLPLNSLSARTQLRLTRYSLHSWNHQLLLSMAQAAALMDLLSQNQPQVQTRQALLIIGLQNDFISPDGRLPVKTKNGFLDRIQSLIPKFRELDGHIVWVQTIYEADRIANDASTGEGDALVVGGLVDGDESSTDGGDDESTKDLPIMQAQSRSSKHRQRALDLLKRVSARRKVIPREEARASVEEDEELFLLKSPKKTPACMPQTNGVQFTSDAESLIQRPRDAVIRTTNYSAFQGTSLLMTLRARLVTEIFICGCITNVSVLATVIDGARHGIKINVVQDALGFRKQTRHDLALKRMEDFFDAWLVTSADILKRERLADVEIPEPSEELDAMVGKLSLKDTPGSASRASNGKSRKSAHSPAAKASVNPDEPSDEQFSDKLVRGANVHSTERNTQEKSNTQMVQAKIRVRSKSRKKKKDSSTKAGASTQPSPTEAAKQSAKPDEPTMEGREKDTGQKLPENGIIQTTVSSNSVDGVEEVPSLSRMKDSESESRMASTNKPTDTTPTNPSPGKEAPFESPEHTTTKSTTAKKPKLQSLANMPVLGPGDHIGEGDCRIINEFFPGGLEDSQPLGDNIFAQLYSEVRWQKMMHQQGEVPRLVCCQGEFGEDGSKPVYRHPADQTLPLLHFSPRVNVVRKQAEKLVGHPLNHVLIQLYRGGSDYISEHSDKTLDIVKGSSIANISFGAQRTMRLRTKKSAKAGEDDESGQRETQRVAMPHNSMFVLGLKTNERWLHGIMADKRMDAERSELEKACSGNRISLTFRHIGTLLDARESTMWGQGATAADQREAADVINDDEEESERMIRAFSQENQSSDFDWDKWYGSGFDVLHLHSPPEDLPILFESNGSIGTKQVQLALWECKIKYTTIDAPTLDKKYTSDPEVYFRDNDAHHTEISTSAAILLYLDRYHPLDRDDRSKPCTAAGYSTILLASRLLRSYQDCGSEAHGAVFADDLAELEGSLRISNGPFIAGKRFSIADCYMWPIVDELSQKWKGWTDERYPALANYHKMTWRKKACVKKLRGEVGGTGRTLDTDAGAEA
jgi:nicotinamidase-related amidase/glutathione S-transferase/alkylated DNA repair dioxygenase AlkB